jgi:hypothetical protein
MLVLDSVGLKEVKVESFMTLPKSISIGGRRFKLGYINLHSADHFTSLHYLQDNWFYYDGMKLEGKLQPATRSTWRNKTVDHTVYFAA